MYLYFFFEVTLSSLSKLFHQEPVSSSKANPYLERCADVLLVVQWLPENYSVYPQQRVTVPNFKVATLLY